MAPTFLQCLFVFLYTLFNFNDATRKVSPMIIKGLFPFSLEGYG